jgi:hypothetical protein
MTDAPKHQGEHHTNTPLRSYHRPKLLVYGALRDLTASGTGKTTETKFQPTADPQPNKRP